MINMFIKLLKNKYFIIWIIIFLFILFFLYNPSLNYQKTHIEIIDTNEILNIFYQYLLPMSFYENDILISLLTDLCYISIVIYIVVNFVFFFFTYSSSITLTRIDRKKWIYNILKINILFSMLITFIYILFFILLCILNNINISIDFKNIIPIIYKFLITIIMPNTYLLFYIKTDSEVLSLGFSIITYVLLEFLIKSTYNMLTYTFNYIFIVIILFIFLYICISYLILILFKRRDF